MDAVRQLQVLTATRMVLALTAFANLGTLAAHLALIDSHRASRMGAVLAGVGIFVAITAILLNNAVVTLQRKNNSIPAPVIRIVMAEGVASIVLLGLSLARF
jgi:hypothetical protein